MNFPDWAPEDLCASYREGKVYWDMPSTKTPEDKGISSIMDFKRRHCLGCDHPPSVSANFLEVGNTLL